MGRRRVLLEVLSVVGKLLLSGVAIVQQEDRGDAELEWKGTLDLS